MDSFPADKYDLNAPPRNVLSDDTIRQALANAAPKSSSRKSSPPSSSTRKAPGHDSNCDCRDCYALSSERGGKSKKSVNADGDLVEEHASDKSGRLHVHDPADFAPAADRPDAPRRSSSGKSSGGASKDIYTGRDRNGDLVQEWAGEQAPKARAHFDWKKGAETLFPGDPGYDAQKARANEARA